MTETTGEVRVRTLPARRSDSLVESVVEFGGGIFRLGFSLIMLPLGLLPVETRTHMRNATRELMYAFATLPRDFAETAGQAIEAWAAEIPAQGASHTKAPKDEVSAN